jgi:hypothetical protein
MDILSAEMTKYAATSILAALVYWWHSKSLWTCWVDINKGSIGSDSIGHKFIHPRIRYDSFLFQKSCSLLKNKANAIIITHIKL